MISNRHNSIKIICYHMPSQDCSFQNNFHKILWICSYSFIDFSYSLTVKCFFILLVGSTKSEHVKTSSTIQWFHNVFNGEGFHLWKKLEKLKKKMKNLIKSPYIVFFIVFFLMKCWFGCICDLLNYNCFLNILS
jgi:hypothetical protein